MLKFGIRTVRTAGHQLLVNDKPFYCKGAGRHEDSDVSMLNIQISVINSPGTQLLIVFLIVLIVLVLSLVVINLLQRFDDVNAPEWPIFIRFSQTL